MSKHWNEGYGLLMNSLIADKNLDVFEFRLVCAVLSYHYVDDKKLGAGYLAKVVGMGRRTVINKLQALEKKGYVTIKHQYCPEKKASLPNIVTPNAKYKVSLMFGKQESRPEGGSAGDARGVVQEMHGGSAGDAHKELTIKELTNKEEEAPPVDMVSKVINELNKQAGKNFKASSRKNKEYINGRLKDGCTYEDFVHVIKVKCEEWKGIEGCDHFLRPKTLFGTKMEDYINQKMRSDLKANVKDREENMRPEQKVVVPLRAKVDEGARKKNAEALKELLGTRLTHG